MGAGVALGVGMGVDWGVGVEVAEVVPQDLMVIVVESVL